MNNNKSSSSFLLWSWEQEKAFERALVENQEDNVDRWERIAAGLPGKTADEVKARYDLLVEDISRIESGLVPLPDYVDEKEPSDDSGGGKRERQAARARKKNQKWTLEEHWAFLQGLAECGKGDWRGISRQYVNTKSASQVASHAQKHFNRRKQSKKKRQSIHDVSLETLMAAATNKSINGYPRADQTDGLTDGYPTNAIPTLNIEMLRNGSSVHQPLQLRDPPPTLPASRPAPACSSTPNSLCPQQFIPGTFIPLFRSDDPRASSLNVAPIAYRVPDTLALSKQEPCRPRDSFHSPVSQDSEMSFPVGHRSHCPSNS